jgi:hypothetical protein
VPAVAVQVLVLVTQLVEHWPEKSEVVGSIPTVDTGTLTGMSEKTFQGDQGVLTAALHYSRTGHIVSTPITEHTKYDLVIDDGTSLSRVQVKSTVYKNRTSPHFETQLRTNGGNYTTKNRSTRIEEAQVDRVFILTGDGSCYDFPVAVLAGRSTVTLGPKYQQYLVGAYPSIMRM